MSNKYIYIYIPLHLVDSKNVDFSKINDDVLSRLVVHVYILVYYTCIPMPVYVYNIFVRHRAPLSDHRRSPRLFFFIFFPRGTSIAYVVYRTRAQTDFDYSIWGAHG